VSKGAVSGTQWLAQAHHKEQFSCDMFSGNQAKRAGVALGQSSLGWPGQLLAGAPPTGLLLGG